MATRAPAIGTCGAETVAQLPEAREGISVAGGKADAQARQVRAA